jgi:hypothetical protein
MEGQISLNKAVRVLREHALVETGTTLQDDPNESLGYSMHSCVHSWTVHVLNKEWDANMATVALECVSRHLPGHNQHSSAGMERRLMRHARRSLEFIVDGRVDSCGREHHLHRFGDMFANQGQFNEAEKMYQQALQGCSR